MQAPSTNNNDVRRPNKITRYKAQTSSGGPLDDPTPEYMNLLGMIFSMCGLMMKALHICSGDVLSPESTANAATMVNDLDACWLNVCLDDMFFNNEKNHWSIYDGYECVHGFVICQVLVEVT
ncbi:hypothetical protein BaRGS_00007612 [Batillaria attramentaria]|uniref:Protein Asterix n=1 Tax=Batillaria attramentaria TaxID=370345 RepID=A0ABD0LP65_9CAEN